jgi:hypothetical protein
MKEYKPLHFFGETIQAIFDSEPLLEKKPGCPAAFVWRDHTYQIVEILSEWHDYSRHGRFSQNMQPQHAARAASRGSWGVGQDYYRVLTDRGRIFELYFDRAPKSVKQRKGEWVLYRELALGE